MKLSKFFLIFLLGAPIHYLLSIDGVRNEQIFIHDKISSLYQQNQNMLEHIVQEEQSLPEDKKVCMYPQVQNLKLALQRQSDTIKTLHTSLSDSALAEDNLPHSDLLQVNPLDVSQLYRDVTGLLKNEDIKNPIEKTAFDWLHPYKNSLPTTINPYSIAKVCMIVPAILSMAAIFSSDQTSVRKEIVTGACKVGIVGVISGYLSYYAAKIWNPFRAKLDNNVVQDDCQSRIKSSVENINKTNCSLAMYYEHLLARKFQHGINQQVRSADQHAQQASAASQITQNMMQDLSAVVDKNDQDARVRDAQHTKKLIALEEGHVKLLESVAVVYDNLKIIHKDFKRTKQDLMQYFHDDQQARDRFERSMSSELGDVQRMQVMQLLQGQRQLYIAEQTAYQQGIVLQNIPSLDYKKASPQFLLPTSSSRLSFSTQSPKISKQMMKTVVKSWTESTKEKQKNQILNILNVDAVGRKNNMTCDHTDVREMAATVMQSAIRGKLARKTQQALQTK